jgi:predicted HTH domain antitoxin
MSLTLNGTGGRPKTKLPERPSKQSIKSLKEEQLDHNAAVVRVIIATFMKEKGLTANKAADLFGMPVSTLKGYLYSRNTFTEDAQAKVLPHLGVNSLEEAALKYDHVNDRVKIFEDLYTQSEGVFLAHFAGARVVRETRIMLPHYPPLPSGTVQYRSTLNKTVFERLYRRELVVHKVEQLNNLDRAVDLVLNIQTFDPNNYEVRYVSCTDVIFPYLQFSIFDQKSVLVGGFHVDVAPPRNEPFGSYVGRGYAAFYQRVWDKLRPCANDFSVLAHEEMISTAIDELKKVKNRDGQVRYPDLTPRHFQELIEKRRNRLQEYATRY